MTNENIEEFNEPDIQDEENQSDDEVSFADILSEEYLDGETSGEPDTETSEEDEQDDVSNEDETTEEEDESTDEEELDDDNVSESETPEQEEIRPVGEPTKPERRVTGIAGQISQLTHLKNDLAKQFNNETLVAQPKLKKQYTLEELVGAYDPDTGDYVAGSGCRNPETGERYTVEEARKFIQNRERENQYIASVAQNQNVQMIQENNTLAEIRTTNVTHLIDVLNDFPELDDKSDNYNPELAYYYEKVLLNALDSHNLNSGKQIPYFNENLYKKAQELVEMYRGAKGSAKEKTVNTQKKSSTPKSNKVSTKRETDTDDFISMLHDSI